MAPLVLLPKNSLRGHMVPSGEKQVKMTIRSRSRLLGSQQMAPLIRLLRNIYNEGSCGSLWCHQAHTVGHMGPWWNRGLNNDLKFAADLVY